MFCDASIEARATYFFVVDKELAYPQPQFASALKKTADGFELTIDSKVLLRDVLIQVDRLDPNALIDDNLITILPGEPRVFVIRSDQDLTVEQLTEPPVFNSANRFGRGGS